MTELLDNMAFISMPGSGEWMVILVIGLLIFGRRLPDVARSLGKSVNEFKKGMREFQESADEVARDVNKVTSDVAADVKEASGMNDYGYEEPSHASQYDSHESNAATEVNPYGAVEPASETPEATADSTPEVKDDPTPQNEQRVEPTA